MTISIERSEADHEAGLEYVQTLDRRMVHRLAVSEVFVTDQRQSGELAVRAAAQLPLSHAYYSDHTQARARFDVLLLVEACRQAGIAGAHLLGLPVDTIMLVSSFGVEITDADVLLMGDCPAEMVIDSAFATTRVRGGQVREGNVVQSFTVGGRQAGTHHMEGTFLTLREHAALRRMQRSTVPPVTSSLPDRAPVNPAPASVVGRLHPLNVVLSDVSGTDGLTTANVTPRFSNRALFDHPYDHIPALVMTEAARQLALASFGTVARDALLTGVNANFDRHAELDRLLTAAMPAVAQPPHEAAVTFAQEPAPGHAAKESPGIVARITLKFRKTGSEE
jgi:hypothetical protein